MGICGRCTSCSHGISRDAQNMSSKLTSQNGEENIILCTYSDSQAYQCGRDPPGCSFSFLFPDSTTALAFNKLDTEAQGQVGCMTIWSTTKCTAIVIFYHLIFTTQNGLQENNILTYLNRWVLWVNGLCWFCEVNLCFHSLSWSLFFVHSLTYIILPCQA